MLHIRRGAERGHANHGWLDSFHTFSFADYHDPAFMGFRSLRVINEDRVEPDQGFDTHPHRNMEIITYVLSGELSHKDSMGNGRVIKAGEVQGMSAGTGVTHSEFNASKDKPVHLLQIWIQPHTRGVNPSYSEWLPDGQEKLGWVQVASENGKSGGVPIHQDARLYVCVVERAKDLPVAIDPKRYGWLQVAKGEAEIAGEKLVAGDGAAFSGDAVSQIKAQKGTELLLFDLA